MSGFGLIAAGILGWFFILVLLGLWSHSNGSYVGKTFIGSPHYCHALPWLWMAIFFGYIAILYIQDGKYLTGLFWLLVVLWQICNVIKALSAWRKGKHTHI